MCLENKGALAILHPLYGKNTIFIMFYAISPYLEWIPILGTYANIEIMSLPVREMGPQLKLPINEMKGSMTLQCNTYFPKILAI